MRRFGRADPREKALAIQRSLTHLADMAGKPRMEVPIPPEPKRRTRSASGKPLERDVLRAVLDALRLHPRVAWFCRMQSGTFVDGDRYIKVGYRGLPDVVFMLKGGTMGAVECKSETGRVTSEQQATLDLIARHGGIAFVARSADDVAKHLG